MPEARMLVKYNGSPYLADMDSVTKTWRVYDLNDPVFDTLTQEDDMPPDNHPCVTILTESAFFELMKTASSLNMLQKMHFADEEKNTEEIDKLKNDLLSRDKKILELESKLTITESAQLKMRGMDSILKIIGMDAVQK